MAIETPKVTVRPNIRIVRRVFAGCVVGLLVLAALMVSALTLGVLEPLRQTIASRILTVQLDRSAEVQGPVRIEFGSQIVVRMEDAVVERYSQPKGGTGRFFDYVRFDAPYRLLLGDLSGISNFEMAGADIELLASPGETTDEELSYYRLPSEVINLPVFEALKLTDVTLHYLGVQSGWNERANIRSLNIAPSEETDTLDIELDADLNGTPLQISGEIARPPQNGPLQNGAFELALAFPGINSKISGRINTSTAYAGVEGELELSSGSLAQALASGGLTSEVDGQVDASWKFSGTLESLSISNIEINVTSRHSDKVTITGAVENASLDPSLDLSLNALLAPFASTDNELAIEILALAGEIYGPLNDLAIRNAQVKTNAAILDIETIGPISVGHIVKSEDGRVGLQELTINNGTDGGPNLTLAGQIDDVIALDGITLAGRFEYPVSFFLNSNREPRPDLGTLVGQVELSDSDSWFALNTFKGAVEGTDLLDFSFDLTVPELRRVDELNFTTEFAIPDPAAVVELVSGAASEPLPDITFSGQSSLQAGELGISGEFLSGSSAISADLNVGPKPETSTWLLSGDIRSEALNLSELSGLAQLAELGFEGPETGLEITDGDASQFAASIHVAAKSLVVGKKKAGDISAHVLFEDEVLSIAELALAYIGGRVSGNLGFNFKTEPPVASIKGRMEKFPLKSLMNELGLTAPISSTVYASLDLHGETGSLDAFLDTLNGKVTTSLWGGRFPDRLIELSGLSVFTWLMSGNSEQGAELVCAVLPLRFKSGKASGNSLVVETENVQIVGGGSVNFKSGNLDLAFLPRAKKKQLVEIVSPFEIKGSLSDPELIVKDGGAGRAMGEVLSLPINVLGHIFSGSGAIDKDARPCVIPKNTGPK
ncbi:MULTISPECIES: AsmA-like C-terminal region-containing protein [unclassified Roseibium]|uniref:AsmA-like C-terminal region-containing protein n=1 Tax=unclassified Roseibium TaxID=2629323 RepID=UPI00273F9D0F|nr:MULTISPECIES: AsmA-like C-terminal region-containing protein [unclassified Roseibium]